MSLLSHSINHSALVAKCATVSTSLFKRLKLFARSICWTKTSHCGKVHCIAKAKITLRIVKNHFLSSMFIHDIMQKNATCNHYLR